MIPHAADNLRESPYYHRDAFHRGLRRLGFATGAPKLRPQPQDVLLIWNRSHVDLVYAARYEAVGARVIVVENGYVGRDRYGGLLFAIALGHHNGAGTWPHGGPERWPKLGLEIEPWRAQGEEIVVLPQRSIGEPGVAMPVTWTEDVVARLRRLTDRPVRVRPHPGKDKTDPKHDLRRAWAAVTWASGAGIKALLYGVPVFFEMPRWIGAPAATWGIDRIEQPWLGDRLPMFERLAWSQWSVEEIEAGEPFAWLLGSPSS